MLRVSRARSGSSAATPCRPADFGPNGLPENETARLIGRIRIDLAVDATEYRDWSPWLKTLVDSMLPAAALAELRWLGRSAFAATDELSDGHSLGDDPLAHLGTDAVTGLVRLAGRERTALPGQILKNSSLH